MAAALAADPVGGEGVGGADKAVAAAGRVVAAVVAVVAVVDPAGKVVRDATPNAAIGATRRGATAAPS